MTTPTTPPSPEQVADWLRDAFIPWHSNEVPNAPQTTERLIQAASLIRQQAAQIVAQEKAIGEMLGAKLPPATRRRRRATHETETIHRLG